MIGGIRPGVKAIRWRMMVGRITAVNDQTHGRIGPTADTKICCGDLWNLCYNGSAVPDAESRDERMEREEAPKLSKKRISLEALADIEKKPESEIEQAVIRTFMALETMARTTRLYSVAGPRMVRTIQRRAVRSIQPLASGEFLLIGEDATQ